MSKGNRKGDDDMQNASEEAGWTCGIQQSGQEKKKSKAPMVREPNELI